MPVFNRIKFFVCLFFSVYLSNGQDLLPPVYNYSLLEYKGGSKNWGLAANKKGELFVANNKGLLSYNGKEWSLYKLPNNTIIRSVATVGDTIYTGSYEEFGFWVPTALGQLEYTSLTPLIKDHLFTSEEFWKILPLGDAIIFHSFSSIYIYKNGEIKVIDPPEVISDIIAYKDMVLVAGGINGLFRLMDDKISPLRNQEILKDKTITDMILLRNGVLVGTKLNGCYFFDGDKIEPWTVDINEDLKRHQLNKLLHLNRGEIALGTIKNGVYIFDLATGDSQIINRNTGLQNNTVLSMMQFQDHLWLGLDNGIARIRLNYPINYYTDYSGALGMVYDMAYYQDRLYLGSNTGVFYFEKNELHFVEGSLGHVWDLEIVNGDLLCGHNTGTFKVVDGNLERISDITGGYEIKKIPEQKAIYIQGTYYGLAKFQKENSGNWKVNRIEGVDFPIKQICFESPTILWAAHPYKGLYRIHLNDDFNSISQTQYYDHKDAPSAYNIKIYNIRNQIVINSEGKWYKYDSITDQITLLEEFQKFNNKELLIFDRNYFWFVDSEGNKEIIRTDLKADSLLIADLPLRKRLAPDSQKMVRTGDSTLLIPLNDGFAEINPIKLKMQLDRLILPVPDIKILDNENNIYSTGSVELQIPYKYSRIITLQVASPQLMHARYKYELSGAMEDSGFTEEGAIQFQSLPYGDYQFEVYTVGMNNRLSNPMVINIEIARPWFLSNLMVILYFFLFLIMIVVVRWYNRKKLMRKHRELEILLKKEQEEKMLELEKEKLAKEIRLKQNELASTTFNMAKKNEMILELKNMLIMNKDKFSNSQRYQSFIKKLNNSIKNTEDWQRFEYNFKELHQDFFERLLTEYPNLTPKDLKLCAYLKMNLSTKEIAPLMAISIRGVEIHRYRLRKKLQIDSSENLSNFLITF